MLSGEKLTDTSLKHAEQLLEMSRSRHPSSGSASQSVKEKGIDMAAKKCAHETCSCIAPEARSIARSSAKTQPVDNTDVRLRASELCRGQL